MQGETDVSYSLSALVTEVEGVALATAQSQEVSDNELSEVLSFLAKVSHVVEQAFRGVLLILIEIKFLRPNDLQPDRMQRLGHKTELVLARSHFRGAEGICSRLRTLTETYQTSPKRPSQRYASDNGPTCIARSGSNSAHSVGAQAARVAALAPDAASSLAVHNA